MAIVQACVQAVPTRSGIGTQTVTGVTDQDGDGFIGTVSIFQSGLATINAVSSGSISVPWYADCIGVDTGALRSAGATSDLYSPFNFKGVSGGSSLGNSSIIGQWTGNFGQSVIERQAKISAQSTGQYELDYLQNDRTGDSLLALILGGSGLDIAFTDCLNGTYTTPSKPQGLLCLNVPAPSASGPTSGGTGGGVVSWGFATRDGAYGTTVLYVNNQSTNYIAQRTDCFGLFVDSSGVLGSDLPTVSAWNDTSFTIANNGGATALSQPIAICGENVRCAGGSITQDAPSFDTGINPRVVLFFSTGVPATTSVGSPVGQRVMGWATPTAQVGWWNGERTPGNVSPAYGARYASDNTVIRFGTPEGAATTFDTTAAVTSITMDGIVTLDWLTSDAGGREILWFAIGEAIPTPPPPPVPVYRTREVVRRRLRRAPIVWSEKGGLQTRVRINLFAVDMQPGVGTADTPDPLVMIRASKDGGFTWSNERRVSAGRIGEYFERINTWRWGIGREWVFEVSCTDPVVWNLVGAYFDAEGGES